MSEKNLHTLSLLEKLTSVQQQKLLRHCDKEFLKFCCECAINVVNGTVGINVGELKQYETQLRSLCKRSTSNKKRRKILMSPKGLKLLNLIIRPCFCYLTDWIWLWTPKNLYLSQKVFILNKNTPHCKFWETQKLNKRQSLSPYCKETKLFPTPQQ